MEANNCLIGQIKKFVRRLVSEQMVCFITLEGIDGKARFIRVFQEHFHTLNIDLIGKGEGYEEPLIKMENVTMIPLSADFIGYADGDDVCFQFSSDTIVRQLTPTEVQQLPPVVRHQPKIVARFFQVDEDWHNGDCVVENTECRIISLQSGVHLIQMKEFRNIGEMEELSLGSQEYEFHCIKQTADGVNFALHSYVKAK